MGARAILSERVLLLEGSASREVLLLERGHDSRKGSCFSKGVLPLERGLASRKRGLEQGVDCTRRGLEQGVDLRQA